MERGEESIEHAGDHDAQDQRHADTVKNCASSLPMWPFDRNVQCLFHK